MAAQGYYEDQPRFARSDPLRKWTWSLLIVALVDLLWMTLLWTLMATGRFQDDVAFGLSQATWVGITTAILIACLIGVFFVIVARLGGGADAGGYLSADLDLEREARAEAAHAPAEEEEVEAVAEEDLVPPAHVPPPAPVSPPQPHKPPARIDQTLAADGRMHLSYTVPEEQPRGIYGDAWVPVDKDAVVNVRTLLGKTQARR